MKIKYIVALVCLGLFFWSCSPGQEESGFSADTALNASVEEAEVWAADILADLSLKQKVAQMICEQMRGDTEIDSPEFEKLIELVRDHEIGAFVLYGGSPAATARLLNRLQQEAKIPLFISSDFEGGPGQQLNGATEFPANMALSAIGSDEVAYQLGEAGAKEGRAVGIHITYSPVVDIQTLPENPVLSVRSFGRDLDQLGRLAGAYIRGYQENGMLATAKHYPGRGDVELIPGTEFTINNKPAEQVEAEDFFAFKLAIDAGVTYIMSEHIAIPSVTDGSDLPASVEKSLASYWLREKLGFKGILTTDDMWYEKVTERFGPVQACVMAVKAGHDAVLKPANVPDVIDGIVAAVQAGEISEAQIDRSVKKILFWKARLNLHRNRMVDVAKIPEVVATPEHTALLNKIADSSLTMLINKGFFPVDLTGEEKIAHVSIQKKPKDMNPDAVASRLDGTFSGISHFLLGAEDQTQDIKQRALDAVKAADLLIISLFQQRSTYLDNGALPPEDLAFLHELIEMQPGSTVVMSYGNPYHAVSFKSAAAFVVGYGEGGFYGNQLIYADSFIRLLQQKIVPQGKLPVKVSEDLPMGIGLTY